MPMPITSPDAAVHLPRQPTPQPAETNCSTVLNCLGRTCAVGVQHVGAGAAEVVVDGELDRRVDAVVEPSDVTSVFMNAARPRLRTGRLEHEAERLVQRPELEADVVGRGVRRANCAYAVLKSGSSESITSRLGGGEEDTVVSTAGQPKLVTAFRPLVTPGPIQVGVYPWLSPVARPMNTTVRCSGRPPGPRCPSAPARSRAVRARPPSC